MKHKITVEGDKNKSLINTSDLPCYVVGNIDRAIYFVFGNEWIENMEYMKMINLSHGDIHRMKQVNMDLYTKVGKGEKVVIEVL